MTVLESARQMVLYSFMYLPLMLIAFLGFMSLALGNVGMIILFLGHVFLIPVATTLLHMISVIIPADYKYVQARDVCNLIPSFPVTPGTVNVFPSYWMAHSLFFMGYFLQNASTLITKSAESGAPKDRVDLRKGQGTTAMIVGIVATIAIVFMRYKLTGCETILGIMIAAITMVPLGVGWYMMATLAGARDGDIFGIAGRIMPLSALAPPPMTCLYKA
jgi:hypothetical protein